MDNKSLSHTKWKCQYHIVFIPKYRKKILYGRVRNDVREIISTLCKYKDVDIIAGAVCVDHIHLSVAIPPKISIANFMGYLKGKSTLMLYDRHPELQSKWDKAFWARGYYVETIGNITDEAVQKYIKEQAEESRKEDSRSTAYSGPVKVLAIPPFWASSKNALLRANTKPPVELVVADLIDLQATGTTHNNEKMQWYWIGTKNM